MVTAKSGALSGKYTRKNQGELKAERGAMVPLGEKTYAIIDGLEKIAKVHESTVARTGLAWVRTRPGVASTIVGARRANQLEDNLRSIDITLSAEELAHLDSLTKPIPRFPAQHTGLLPAIRNGETAISGVAAGASMIIEPG